MCFLFILSVLAKKVISWRKRPLINTKKSVMSYVCDGFMSLTFCNIFL